MAQQTNNEVNPAVPAVVPSQTGLVDARMYEKLTDPLQAIRSLGEWIWKSGMFGAKQPEQGMLLAWTAIAKQKDPLDLSREFHIIKGRLSKRADSALAEFLSKGGKRRVKWLSDLASREEAKFVVTDRYGETYTWSFTMKDAEEAGYTRGEDGIKDNWKNSAPDMLRARLIMKTMRMIEPEIVVGLYAPEELRDGEGGEPAAEVPNTSLFGTAPPSPAPEPPRAPVETTAAVVEQPKPVSPPAPVPPAAASTVVFSKQTAVLEAFKAESTLFDKYCLHRNWIETGECAADLSEGCISNIYENLGMVKRNFSAWKRAQENRPAATPATPPAGGAQ